VAGLCAPPNLLPGVGSSGKGKEGEEGRKMNIPNFSVAAP